VVRFFADIQSVSLLSCSFYTLLKFFVYSVSTVLSFNMHTLYSGLFSGIIKPELHLLRCVVELTYNTLCNKSTRCCRRTVYSYTLVVKKSTTDPSSEWSVGVNDEGFLNLLVKSGIGTSGGGGMEGSLAGINAICPGFLSASLFCYNSSVKLQLA